MQCQQFQVVFYRCSAANLSEGFKKDNMLLIANEILWRCFMKRFISTITACFLILILPSTTMALPHYGTFPFWYSDSTSIGRFESTNNTVGFAIESGAAMTAENLIAYTDHALFTAWPLRNYTYTGTDYNSARLKVAVITRGTANNLGLPSNAVGVNGWVGHYISATGSYGGITRAIFTIPCYQTFLVWDSITRNFSTNQWRNVSSHEHGHGIGYAGHNSNSTQLMFHQMNSATTAQLQDKRHMRNMYTID